MATTKIVVIGNVNVGKTSLCQKYANGTFTSEYKATVGVDFVVKDSYQLWDVAGQERFSAITSAYYRGAAGALVVLDWNQADGVESAKKWIEDLHKKYTADIPILVVANKCDLPALVSVEDLDSFCKGESPVVGWIKTSAKTGVGVEEAIKQLAEYLPDPNEEEKSGIIRLEEENGHLDNENWAPSAKCC